MKKVLNWVIGAILVIYGAIMTKGAISNRNQARKLCDELIHEQTKGIRVRDKVRKRLKGKRCKTFDDYSEIIDEILEDMRGTAEEDDTWDDLNEEYHLVDMIRRGVELTKYDWLDW